MTNQQLIPTEELFNQWCYASSGDWREVAAIAARWGYKQGADQELEACCEWLREFHPGGTEQLRVARRPKPPSLKEQALGTLNLMLMFLPPGDQQKQSEIIRRALEQLPN